MVKRKYGEKEGRCGKKGDMERKRQDMEKYGIYGKKGKDMGKTAGQRENRWGIWGKYWGNGNKIRRIWEKDNKNGKNVRGRL